MGSETRWKRLGPVIAAFVDPATPPSGWTVKRDHFRRLFEQHVVRRERDPNERPPRAYWALAALRFALAALPLPGYVHPDEFFQTLEPVAGRTLDVEWHRAWEFNASFPLRNMMLPYLTIGVPLEMLKTADSFAAEYLGARLITPYSLLVLPRLVFCAISFVNDYCLLSICRMYGKDFAVESIAFASSYVTLIYCTRTFTNSLEAVLLSALLLSVSECMLASNSVIKHDEILSKKYERAESVIEKVRLFKLIKLLPEYSLRRCFQIATLTVIGIFNRPTFVAFAFPSVFLWLFRGLGSRTVGFKEFHMRLFIFVLNCLPILLFLVIVDSSYYGYLTVSDIESREVSINNFVVTPLNFLRYNMFTKNLSKHGVHPRWLHLFINVPLLFHVLGIVGLFTTFRIIYRLIRGNFGTLPRIQSISGLMSLSIAIPIIILSMFPHQEARFLIPLLVPIVFLYTQYVRVDKNDSRWKINFKKTAFVIWCILNIFFSIFFGFIHQGGIYSAANHFHKEISVKPKTVTFHIITSHIYSVPQTLFLTKDTSRMRVNKQSKQKYKLSKQLFVYELGSKSIVELVKYTTVMWNINESKLKQSKEPFRLYLLLPTSLKRDLIHHWGKSNMSMLTLKEERHFFPHLSTEAIPYFPRSNDLSCIPDHYYTSDITWNIRLTILEKIICFTKQFSLILYKVEKYSHFMS